jgi:hypothetical protein
LNAVFNVSAIPAPAPSIAKGGTQTQAKQDPDDPERAYNSITGQTLVWDRARSGWIDTRSQRNIGFQGAFVSGTGAAGAPTAAAPAPSGFSFGFGIGGGTGVGQDRDKLGNRRKQERDRITTGKRLARVREQHEKAEPVRSN